MTSLDLKGLKPQLCPLWNRRLHPCGRVLACPFLSTFSGAALRGRADASTSQPRRFRSPARRHSGSFCAVSSRSGGQLAAPVPSPRVRMAWGIRSTVRQISSQSVAERRPRVRSTTQSRRFNAGSASRKRGPSRKGRLSATSSLSRPFGTRVPILASPALKRLSLPTSFPEWYQFHFWAQGTPRGEPSRAAPRACAGRQRRPSYQPRATPWVCRPKTMLSAESATHGAVGLGFGGVPLDGESGPNQPDEGGRWPARG